MTEVLRVQLAALAVHLDAVAQLLRAAATNGQPSEPKTVCPACRAGEEFLEDASTIGHRMVRCTKCMAEWDV